MQNGEAPILVATNGEQPGDASACCHILGVYSCVHSAETGHGATSRTYQQKTLWFVRRLDDDLYSVQALNANDIPSGPIATISKGEFIRSYHPEPGFYEKRCLPFIESLQKKLKKAESCLVAEDMDGAEKEFCKALLLDEKNPKANIELGKIYLQGKDGKKLKLALKRILGIDALFQEQERHLFNDFGICLRKSKHFSEAIAFYDKAIDRSADDEHLYFNIARAKAESGDQAGAREALEQALSLRPDFSAAQQFLTFLDQSDDAALSDLPEVTVPRDASL